jgi:hypothetical protein
MQERRSKRSRHRRGRPNSWPARARAVGGTTVLLALLAVINLLVPAAGASPTRLGGPAGRPVASSPATSVTTPGSVGAGGPGVVAKGGAKTAKNAKKGKASKPVQPFIEPRPVVTALLTELAADEHQFLALRTYTEAEGFVGRAEQRSARASSALARAVTALAATRAAERRAVLTEDAARAQVHLYQSALYELGMAEYTGQAAMAGTDLASEERQVELSELSTVAAHDGGAGLGMSRRSLATAARHVQAEKAAVAAATLVTRRARSSLQLARAQLMRSQHALAVTRTWAVVPGAAPAQPSRVLLALETAPARDGSRGGGRGAGGVLVAGALRGPVPLPASRKLFGPTTTSAAAQPTTTVARRPSTSAGRSTSGRQGADAPWAGSQPWTPADAGGPTILGPSLLSVAQLAGWFESTGERANTTVPLEKLARYYMEAGQLTGVRGDIAFAQSIVETGYFSFPASGQDAPGYNNFAGIGACGSCKHGWKFPSALSGVMTQESLLSEYAEPPPLYGPPGGLVAGLGVAGCCRTWMALSGVWASNPNYGYVILSVYREMLDWAVGDELQKAGLTPAWANSTKVLRG